MSRRDLLGATCVLGAGALGIALCHRLLLAGREVILTARDLDKARDSIGNRPVAVLPGTEAFRAAQSIFLAVPYPAALRLATRFPAFAEDKTVVDTTNPLTPQHDGLLTEASTCGAIEIARAIPYVRLVKAFNTVRAESLLGTQPDPVHVAGDEPDSKSAVLGLVAAMGLSGVDVGPLVHARQLEGLVLLRHAIAARNPTAIMGEWRACV